MKVLAVTNLFPTTTNPWLGTFVEQQVKGLQEIGLDVDVLSLDRAKLGPQVYLRMREGIRQKFTQKKYDLVHVMYGGVMAYLATGMFSEVPSIVTIHGSDLLGDGLADPITRFSAYVGVHASRRAVRRAIPLVGNECGSQSGPTVEAQSSPRSGTSAANARVRCESAFFSSEDHSPTLRSESAG